MPIESGMVVEEPDIEIGQGVSSKAISRRMQTDKGGNNGPKSTRDREEEDNPRFRRGDRDDRRDDDRRDHDRKDRYPAISAPPSMPPIPPFSIPGYPFSLPTLPNGMPMLPPGFPAFPGQPSAQPQQPPPPGHRNWTSHDLNLISWMLLHGPLYWTWYSAHTSFLIISCMATVSWRLFMVPHIWKLMRLELARSSHNLSRIFEHSIMATRPLDS